MGFLDRVIGGVNAVYKPWSDLTDLTDPSLTAADRRMVEGDLAIGTIVGVKRWYDEGTEERLAVAAVDEAGEVHRFGIEIRLPSESFARLRLGLQVPLRIEGKKAVIDPVALGDAFGLTIGSHLQRSKRSAPDDGIDDSAVDARFQKRLQTWTRTTATVTTLEPFLMMGRRTENWNVHVRLPDGTTAVSPKDVVPFYVQSLVAPGTTVPVAHQPGGDVVAIDWAELALATPPSPDPTTPPPEGSIAALLVEAGAAAAASAAPAMGAGAATFTPVRPAAEDHPSGVSHPHLRVWVEQLQLGHLKAKHVERDIQGYLDVGMCTPEEAAEARRAAGLL
jgi:hypothetical protein